MGPFYCKRTCIRLFRLLVHFHDFCSAESAYFPRRMYMLLANSLKEQIKDDHKRTGSSSARMKRFAH